MLRRTFVRSVPLAFAGTILEKSLSGSSPSFRDWNITAYDARPDSTTIHTTIIQTVIDKAAAAGGGTVRVPAGTFLTGALRLRSNVTLHLEAGAVLEGSSSLVDYPETGLRHLVVASDCQNVALTGSGTLDGHAEAFLQRNLNREPFDADKEWLDVAIFDWKPVTSMAAMVCFERCKGVVVSGVTLRHSPRWTLNLDRCDTVRVEGVQIRNLPYTPESDGIDIVCSSNVLVNGCDIATGDDAICLKSEGKGELLPTRNVAVTGCVLTGCCNGFKIGTGTHGVFENIQFTDSVITNEDSQPQRERLIGAVCVEMVDGGRLDGVLISRIRIRNARTPLFIRLGARSGGSGTLRNVRVENVTATGALSASAICGIPGNAVRSIRLSNVHLGSSSGVDEHWATQPVPELAANYPEALMFEHLPAYGLYVRHAEELSLDGLQLTAEVPDERPALVLDDVCKTKIVGFTATPPRSSQPTVAANDVFSMSVHDSRALPGTGTFLRVTGAESHKITLAGNDLSRAARPVIATNPSAVRLLPKGS